MRSGVLQWINFLYKRKKKTILISIRKYTSIYFLIVPIRVEGVGRLHEYEILNLARVCVV